VIVPMKEVTIALARSDAEVALSALQRLGVLHLSDAPKGGTERVEVWRGRFEAAKVAREILDHAPAATTAAGVRPAPVEEEGLVREVVRLGERVGGLGRTLAEIDAERARTLPFGPFDPLGVERLQLGGVGVRLARAPLTRPLPQIEDAIWVELARDRRRRTLALVGPRAAVAAAVVADELTPPSQTVEALDLARAEAQRALEVAQGELAALKGRMPELERWLHLAEDRLQLEEARSMLEPIGAVRVVRGYVPLPQVPALVTLAAARGWGLWVEEVRNPDAAPTLIANPRWVKPIEPLFGFLGVVPGYGSVDISIPFLLFFGLFFAMIVGDAGYGLLFLLLSEVLRWRMPPAAWRVIRLLRGLSLATIVWGVLTGSFFGMAALPSVLLALRLDWFGDERNVMALAFTIGVVHLTLAHTWNVVRFLNDRRALVEIGWIGTTWGMYFLARSLVLGEPFPPFAYGLLGVGAGLIALFITPWAKLRSEWFSHVMLPLSLVSNFVDVVSYIRLFAVGAATFAVAQAFNDLAVGVGIPGFLGGVVSALILFFGHTLNVLLAAMGVLVHGVRLNTLEFAGHLGLSWSGKPYRPFAHGATLGVEGES
jgi:V/A-type H+/Na+-transporting ATPase subunit I